MSVSTVFMVPKGQKILTALCCHQSALIFVSTTLINYTVRFLFQPEDAVTFDFIRPGQHLGALGCLIKGLEDVEGRQNLH